MRKLRQIDSLYIRLSLFTVLVILTTYFFTEEKYLWAILLLILDGFMLRLIYQSYKRHIKKIFFLLDAFENDDNTFIFSEDSINRKDKLMNQYFNRINKILHETKRKAAQKEKYYELILNSVNTGIVVLDEKGYVYEVNNIALHLLGLITLTHIKQLDSVDKNASKILEHITPKEKVELTLNHSNKTIHLAITVSGITLQEKALRILSLTDIKSELDKKEGEAWNQLTCVLTHEIMNAVTPIISLSDTLQSLPEVNPEISNGLEVISTTGKGLISFTKAYRQFTQLPKPQPQLFYVGKFIRRMVKLARHQYPTENIEFSVSVQPDDLILYADENLISQVVINLLKNAIESAKEENSSHISIVTCCNHAEEITIEITNNGTVISPALAEHIFIPFFTTKEKGNGIGLSISRQIMHASGGNLYLKHSSPEKGTTFVLEFK